MSQIKITGRAFLALAAFFVVAHSNAQTYITVDTTVSANDTTYDLQDVIVSGATLTIDGYHEFSSLTLESNAVIRHSASAAEKLDLVVTSAVVIDATSSVTIVGRGDAHTSSVQHAGGSYGGGGGTYSSAYPTNAEYGDFLAPTDYGISRNTYTRGGGAIKLTAASLQLDGDINANGSNGSSGWTHSGGGSGGSVWLDVGTLSGSGTISANGGDGYSGNTRNGGGGGGRIAVYAQTVTTFNTSNIFSNGGLGHSNPGHPRTKKPE